MYNNIKVIKYFGINLTEEIRFMMKTMTLRKEIEETQINGEISHVHGLEDLVSKCSYYLKPLVSLIFLKKSLVFPILLFSSISLNWSLRKAFLSILAIFWSSAFRCLYLSFSPFHAKIGTIKDRNGMDLTEAEDIKKRWQEYTRTIQKRSSWPR